MASLETVCQNKTLGEILYMTLLSTSSVNRCLTNPEGISVSAAAAAIAIKHIEISHND